MISPWKTVIMTMVWPQNRDYDHDLTFKNCDCDHGLTMIWPRKPWLWPWSEHEEPWLWQWSDHESKAPVMTMIWPWKTVIMTTIIFDHETPWLWPWSDHEKPWLWKWPVWPRKAVIVTMVDHEKPWLYPWPDNEKPWLWSCSDHNKPWLLPRSDHLKMCKLKYPGFRLVRNVTHLHPLTRGGAGERDVWIPNVIMLAGDVSYFCENVRYFLTGYYLSEI